MTGKALAVNENTETPAADDEQMSGVLSRDVIAALAYQLWQERGCPIGSPEEDWRKAEEQLRRGIASAR